MLLKPYSVSSGIDYLDFLKSNYICRIKDHGLKKINVKGLNKIGKANDPDFKELNEENNPKRKFEELELNPILICEEEKKDASKILKTRFDDKSDVNLNFSGISSSFSIEMSDIIAVDEMKFGDLSKGIEVIKDSMIFAEKVEAFECFADNLEKYSKYLENPSDFNILKESKSGLEECLSVYSANPYANFLLGLIYHRPGNYFDLKKSAEYFESSKRHSSEMEDHYMKALSGFMLSWLYYVTNEPEKAISELIEVTDEEFMRIPEVYYNLSKFYAFQGDHENSIKYLDEAVTRFDYFYAFKADIDEDFDRIKPELIKYYEKMIGTEKEKISESLKQFGIYIKNDEDNTAKEFEGEGN